MAWHSIKKSYYTHLSKCMGQKCTQVLCLSNFLYIKFKNSLIYNNHKLDYQHMFYKWEIFFKRSFSTLLSSCLIALKGFSTAGKSDWFIFGILIEFYGFLITTLNLDASSWISHIKQGQIKIDWKSKFYGYSQLNFSTADILHHF